MIVDSMSTMTRGSVSSSMFCAGMSYCRLFLGHSMGTNDGDVLGSVVMSRGTMSTVSVVAGVGYGCSDVVTSMGSGGMSSGVFSTRLLNGVIFYWDTIFVDNRDVDGSMPFSVFVAMSVGTFGVLSIVIVTIIVVSTIVVSSTCMGSGFSMGGSVFGLSVGDCGFVEGHTVESNYGDMLSSVIESSVVVDTTTATVVPVSTGSGFSVSGEVSSFGGSYFRSVVGNTMLNRSVVNLGIVA